MNEYQDLWNQTREKLQSNLNEVTFQQTFSDVKHVIKEEKGVIYVMTPSTFIKSKINNLYVRQISEILQTLTNKTLKFKFVTEEEMNSKPKLHYDIPFISKSNLNQNYTFESFVIGESNRLSYLTAVKVAEQPGTIFNPLYIFGGVGLGKTHLMQAIGNYISESNLDYKILYVQASEFIEDYARATRDNKLQTFEEKYGNLDLLLVDDIQMLAKGKSSQEEFFKLFEEMTYRQRQIIITSDRLPEQLNGMMDRLTSRFQRGMRVEINQPDLTQRINILKRSCFFAIKNRFLKNRFLHLTVKAENQLLYVFFIKIFFCNDGNSGVNIASVRLSRHRKRSVLNAEIAYRKRILHNKCVHFARFKHTNRNRVGIKAYCLNLF